MLNFSTKDIVVLDVTSSAISTIVGSRKAESVFDIKNIFEKTYSGFEDGNWLDVDDTCTAINDVLTHLRTNKITKSKRLFVGVPAEFLSVITKHVQITLDRNRKIVDSDIAFLLKKGENFNSSKFVTISSSALYYTIDNKQTLYSDVRNFKGTIVSACVSYILCDRMIVELIENIAKSYSFKDIRFLSSDWAQCLGLFERENRNEPFVLLDIGYISSSVTIGYGEGILDMKSFSLGGAYIASDAYEFLEVPFDLASRAKELVDLNLKYSDDAILVGDKQFTIYANDMSEIAKARLDMFADIILDILKNKEEDYPDMPVFLTGEGIAQMRGARKILAESLGKSVNLVMPKLPGYTKPHHSSKIALLMVADTLLNDTFYKRIKRII